MASSFYLVRKPAPPSDLKLLFDQRIMPVAIDGAACLDVGLVKIGQQMQRNPTMAFGLVGVGILLAAWLRPRGTRKV